MFLQFSSRAALSVAIGTAVPILSSACVHDFHQSVQRPIGAERERPGPRGDDVGQLIPRSYRPTTSLPQPQAATRGGGPTYVEAVFEQRKSAVGPPFQERFHGFAAVRADGRSNIEIQNVGQTVRCSGRSRVTKPPTGPGATGLRGEAFVSCTDGRYATADYRYVTNTRGMGEGQDYLGNRFTIRFMVVP